MENIARLPDENIARVDIIMREDHGGVETSHGPQEPVHLRPQVELQQGRGAGPLPLRDHLQANRPELVVIAPRGSCLLEGSC